MKTELFRFLIFYFRLVFKKEKPGKIDQKYKKNLDLFSVFILKRYFYVHSWLLCILLTLVLS